MTQITGPEILASLRAKASHLTLLFVQDHERHAGTVSEDSLKAEPELIEAYSLGLAAILLQQSSLAKLGEFESNHPSTAALPLIAQAIQGFPITHICITGGIYAQAANLLKQQMETCAALREIQRKSRKDGKTPNVGNAMPRLLNQYSELNNIAHPGSAKIIDALHTEFRECRNITGWQPRFIHEHFRLLLKLEVYLLLLLNVQTWQTLETLAGLTPAEDVIALTQCARQIYESPSKT